MTLLGWLTLAGGIAAGLALLAMVMRIGAWFPLDPEQAVAKAVVQTEQRTLAAGHAQIEKSITVSRARPTVWRIETPRLVRVIWGANVTGYKEARARFGVPRRFQQRWMEEELRAKESELNTRVATADDTAGDETARRWRIRRER